MDFCITELTCLSVRRKLENHSLWHRSGITSVRDFRCGAFQSDRERFCILALEDDYARLQKRLSQMFGMEAVRIFISLQNQNRSMTDWKDELVTFVTEHKDARLIIIDTLQKVREVGGDKFSYASDYEIVTKLKAFSDKYGICFLVVHHTRKMDLQIVLI